MEMKKILTHYLAGGTLVSPEGHTLRHKEDSVSKTRTARITLEDGMLQKLLDPVEALSMYDWEIQREPGVYRVAWNGDLGGNELAAWDGTYWTTPWIDDKCQAGEPKVIIERVEAEPGPKEDVDAIKKELHDRKISHSNISVMYQEQLDKLKALEDNNSVMERLKQMAGGFVPDWGNWDETKWIIQYHNDEVRWRLVTSAGIFTPGVVYFRTAEDAQAAIDELGDELLK